MVNKDLYEAMRLEQAIKKGVDVLVLNLQREARVRFGVELKKKDVLEIINKLVEERVSG